uniref:hypothetical protein n=1 Tax=Butyricimonas paravirosa TaxID=1472417 RepID=UPI001E35298B
HYKILIFCKFTLLEPYKQLYYNILIYRTPLNRFLGFVVRALPEGYPARAGIVPEIPQRVAGV